MDGECTVRVKRPIKEVLAEAPKGKMAMFRITSVPSNVSEHTIGCPVYVHRGLVYAFNNPKSLKGIKAENLEFVCYMDK